ncbi:assimilatory nitrate reductase catalytic subunit [Abditibacteriota bacterium]|nr:assimilatory nitrate reductase catalytic subunit [Abditibacteriota bacterium]
MQCGMNLNHTHEGWSIEARDFPTNRGGMCRKGWTSIALLEHPERLTAPLIRREKGGSFEAVSWDEALDFVASRFIAIQSEQGRDSVGVFGGGGLTNEKAYALGKFARVALKTANIDYNGRYCMASAAAAGLRAYGIDRGLPFPMQDIAGADTVFLFGSNLAETMPPIVQWFDELKENGGKLIVVDPRETPTARLADVHLQITPGSDLALANAMLSIAVEENLIDEEFIATRTNGFECAREVAGRIWNGYIEWACGIDEEQVREVTRMLFEGNSMFLSARGAEQHANGTETVMGFINVALAMGKAGKTFNGYGTLTGQGNGQGGREHGQKCDQLPGYRKILDPIHRAEVADHWGVSLDELPGAGKNAVDLLNSIGEPDGIRALWTMGSNLVISSPNANRVRQKIESLDLLVVSDLFMSETAQLADVVLPSMQWAEEEGTMTNLEGRVLKRNRAAAAPEGARSDLWTIQALAERLGQGDKFFPDARTTFDELRRVTKGAPADYSGISYEGIDQHDGMFWPCPDEQAENGGTQRLFLDRFAHPDGRAVFHPVEWWGRAEEPDEQYPLFFTTGRTMAQYQSGTQTRRVKELNAVAGRAWVELHPDLALELNIEHGEIVRVSSRRGAIEVEARLTDAIRPDTLFAPFHYAGQGCANLLTIPALDPISKMPEFKVCAAKIEKVGV